MICVHGNGEGGQAFVHPYAAGWLCVWLATLTACCVPWLFVDAKMLYATSWYRPCHPPVDVYR
jgi:hypothetical protein